MSTSFVSAIERGALDVRLSWPFSRTYEVRCPDGSVRTVYKHVDDAFPLHVRNWRARFAADVAVPDVAGAGDKARPKREDL